MKQQILSIAIIILMVLSISVIVLEQAKAAEEKKKEGEVITAEDIEKAKKAADEAIETTKKTLTGWWDSAVGTYVEKAGTDEQKKVRLKETIEAQYKQILELEKKIDEKLGITPREEPAEGGFDCLTPQRVSDLIKSKLSADTKEVAKIWERYYANCKDKPGYKVMFDKWEEYFKKAGIELKK